MYVYVRLKKIHLISKLIQYDVVHKNCFNFMESKTRELRQNKLYRPVMEIKVKVSTPNQLSGLSNRQKLLHLKL